MSDSVKLTPVDRQKVQEWVAAHETPQQVALRCRIVLGAAEGEADSAIARRLSVNRSTVILWRKRFVELGPDGLWDVAPGRGQKPIYAMDKIAAVVDATLQTKPAGMTHWSCRTLAQQQGISKSTVNKSGAQTVVADPIGALAHLQLGRALVLAGEKTEAKIACQDFLTLWKDAYPGVPIFRQAEPEYAKLQ